jgi:peroxiredoxin Q/BCP
MLEAGNKAPSFSLESDAKKKVSLADFKGSPVVVYFYPRDNTPGCTREAIAFSAAAAKFAKLGVTVLGISKDSLQSHEKFRAQHGLKITLLSDPDLAVHKAFGAFGEKTMYGKKVQGVIRSTFLVDGAGKIAKVFPSVKVDGHADKVLAFFSGDAAGDKAPPAKTAAKSAPRNSAVKKTATKKR